MRIILRFVVFSAFVPIACGGTAQVSARDRAEEAVSSQSAAPAVDTSSTIPEKPRKLALRGLPADVGELRFRSDRAPDGRGAVNVTWYGSDFGVTFTSNVTVGNDAGAWMKSADEHAIDVGTGSGAPDAGKVPPSEQVKVGTSDAIVYGDVNGWTSISWSPRSDLLLSVTGWNTTFDQVETLAKDAELQE